MENLKDRPAGSFALLNLIGDLLGIDPEIADEYMFRFVNTWGKESLSAVIKFMEWADKNDMLHVIKPTLEQAFAFEKKEDGKLPLVLYDYSRGVYEINSDPDNDDNFE